MNNKEFMFHFYITHRGYLDGEHTHVYTSKSNWKSVLTTCSNGILKVHLAFKIIHGTRTERITRENGLVIQSCCLLNQTFKEWVSTKSWFEIQFNQYTVPTYDYAHGLQFLVLCYFLVFWYRSYFNHIRQGYFTEAIMRQTRCKSSDLEWYWQTNDSLRSVM